MLSPLLPFVLAVGVVTTNKPTEPPIACGTNALDKTERKRQQELLELVRRTAQATQELPDGFAFRRQAIPGSSSKRRNGSAWSAGVVPSFTSRWSGG
jgi:hypothetical protein